jgi:hypothetical protein
MVHRPAGASIHRVPALVAVVLLVLPLTATALDPPPAPVPADLIVGLSSPSVNTSILTTLGATILRQNVHIAIALVHVPDEASFMAAAAAVSNISFVEMNNATALDSSGWDSSGWDSSGWDSSGWDSSGWDSSGWDSSGWDSSGWDSSGWDSSGWDSSGWDMANVDSSGWDSSGWDSSGWDSSGWDSSGWDSSGWDATNGSHLMFNATWLSSAGAPHGVGYDPLLHRQWGLRAVNASPRTLHASLGAQTVCVVDSGVDYTHPDLAGRIWTNATGAHGYDFVNHDSDPMDDAGHGTHVAGILAAVTGNGRGIAGMANVKILAAKVLAANGTGTEYDLADGITYCADQGAKVISMSLSTPDDVKAVRRAVQYATTAGAALVASVGNTGPNGGLRYPAAYKDVIAVGAIMPDGTRAPYSNTGTPVDLAAPGWGIVSTFLGGGYRALNGTSQAVPWVSASLAILLDQNATLRADQAARILQRTAHDVGPAGRDNDTGWGVVDIGKALKLVAGV